MFMSFIAFSKPCLFDKSKIPTVKNQKQDSYIFCEKDTDCVLVKEACRSCTQDQLSVHKDFLEKFNQLEIEFRTKEKCIRSCEACS